MKKEFNVFYLLLFSLSVLISCKQKTYPAEVTQALAAAGKNQPELIKVFDYYGDSSSDSLKLKAAYALVASLRDRYYYQSPMLDHYLEYSKLVKRQGWFGDYIMNSIYTIYGSFSYENFNKIYCLQSVKADSLITDIDFSYKLWREQPWARKYSFDLYCQYILPYMIGDEQPQFDRTAIYKKYNPLLDSVRKVGGDAKMAGFVINEKLKQEGWTFSIRQGFLPHLGASVIITNRLGNCREMADLATYVMRGVGIPVGNDFLPQWPTRSFGHNWNVLLLPDGSFVDFLGAEDSPGVPHFPGTKRAKIYRQTFQPNPNSLALTKDKKEFIPDFLTDPFITDVTDLYVKTYDIPVPLIKPLMSKHAYITVFNNKNWEPVAWGTIKNDSAIFPKLESDIIYMPAYFTNAGVSAANYPFLLRKNGAVEYMRPDPDHPIKQLTFTQIEPIPIQDYDSNSLIDGYFQGANRKDFSDAQIIYKITDDKKPKLYHNEIVINCAKNFRYVRYQAPKNRYTECNLAEMKVFDIKGQVKGSLFSPKTYDPKDPFNVDKVADSDPSTAFISSGKNSSAWVAMDLGEERRITKIDYAPGPHKKSTEIVVVPGHHYELFYWDKKQWSTLGEKLAVDSSVVYHNIPGNAVYLLHDNTKTMEERIFTYANGKICWY